MSFDGYFSEYDSVLENKLGITDPKEMQAVEADIVAYEMSELLAHPPTGEMDFHYLRQLHNRLF